MVSGSNKDSNMSNAYNKTTITIWKHIYVTLDAMITSPEAYRV